MKKVGLIGGLGPASTVDYYNDIIEGYRARVGGDCYPEFFLYNINMKTMVDFVLAEDYENLGALLAGCADALRRAGADFVAICSNTPHIGIKQTLAKTDVPFVNIIDAICDEAKRLHYKKTLILGTSWTMKNGLFQNAFSARGLGYVMPSAEDIERIGSIIYPNLENGIIIPADRDKMLEIVEREIAENNCDAALLGCTEIPLIIKEGDLSVPIMDSTKVHVEKILSSILND